MRKLTEIEKQANAEQRQKAQATAQRLAWWNAMLSSLLAVGMIVWLSVYVREASLQGAFGSNLFWLGLVTGLGILAYLIKKFFTAAKVARKL